LQKCYRHIKIYIRALVLLAIDDAPGVVDGEVILVLRAFSGADGGNDVDSPEDSWSRFVLCFLLGLELLCFPWDGFYIRVDGLVGGGFSFRLGRSGLPRPDVDCLELLVLSSEAYAMCSAAQRRWRRGCERLRSLTADALSSRISCGFPMQGVGFLIWVSGGVGGCARRHVAWLLESLHRLAGTGSLA
jgi:hypothetical protein